MRSFRIEPNKWPNFGLSKNNALFIELKEKFVSKVFFNIIDNI
jgi:hypothetical protein